MSASDNTVLNGRISIEKAIKIYADVHGRDTQALNGINLEIKPGEFICLLGASGCGKSTLLRSIAGLDTLTEGSIKVDGETIDQPHHSRGFVFQDPTLFPWLTVKGNVSVGLDARGSLCRNDVDDYLELVGLEEFGNAYPHQLSGGMAQRAALARALINQPKVLLLDEPLGALDAITRMQMQDELLRIWQEKKTTLVFVTHDIDEAIYLSDRIAVMSPRPGRIKKVVDVPFGRPRARNNPDFLRLRSTILEMLDFAREDALSYYI